ncbi:VOC family protein [Halalkalibacter sp. AB-rgal2]|uniref:VOC family protein n=1 Tax=Halalkalibacter sp. AB-rgal2 TaxID=3242695 RepID=UPI00359ED6B7
MQNIREVGELCWLDLKTADMACTKSFYNKLFGWGYHDEKWPHKTYPIIKQQQSTLGGLTNMNDTPLPEGTPSHLSVYFATHSIDSITANCRRGGGQILVEPFYLEDLMHLSVIQDPDGAIFSLLKTGTFQAMNVLKQNEGVPSYIELTTPNLNKSMVFYTQIFGWTFKPFEYDFTQAVHIQIGHRIIGVMTSSKSGSSEWNVYYTVNSIEDTAQRAQNLGAQSHSNLREIPHIGKVCIFSDPVGITFGLIEYSRLS